MRKILKVLVLLVVALVLLLAAVAFALHRWVDTDDFRQRVAREASAALGVLVTLGGVAVEAWPLPTVALSNIAVQSKPALTLARLEVRPQWWPLLQGRLAVATLRVEQAVLPQQGIDAVLLLLQKKKQATKTKIEPQPKTPSDTTGQDDPLAWLPRRTVLEHVTWISGKGARTVLNAEVRLSEDGLPDSISLKLLEGYLQGLHAKLKRQQAGGSAPRVKTNGGCMWMWVVVRSRGCWVCSAGWLQQVAALPASGCCKGSCKREVWKCRR